MLQPKSCGVLLSIFFLAQCLLYIATQGYLSYFSPSSSHGAAAGDNSSRSADCSAQSHRGGGGRLVANHKGITMNYVFPSANVMPSTLQCYRDEITKIYGPEEVANRQSRSPLSSLFSTAKEKKEEEKYDPDFRLESNVTLAYRRQAFTWWEPPVIEPELKDEIVDSRPNFGCLHLHNYSDVVFTSWALEGGFSCCRAGLAVTRSSGKLIDVSFKPFLFGCGLNLSDPQIGRLRREVQGAAQRRGKEGNCTAGDARKDLQPCNLTTSELSRVPGGYWLVPRERRTASHTFESFLLMLAHYYGSGLLARRIPIIFAAATEDPPEEARLHKELLHWVWDYLPGSVKQIPLIDRRFYEAPYVIFSATAASSVISPCSFQFMSEYLVPTVIHAFQTGARTWTYAHRLQPSDQLPKKIAVLKKRSLHGRKVAHVGAKTLRLLQEEGYAIVDDTAPIDERLVLLNNAEIVLTMWGATYSILARLWGSSLKVRPPIKFIVLYFEAAYWPEWDEYLQTRARNPDRAYRVEKESKSSLYPVVTTTIFGRCLEWAVSNAHCKHIKIPREVLDLDAVVRRSWLRFPEAEEYNGTYVD